MSDIGWGALTQNATYGVPFDTASDFEEVSFEESRLKFKEFMHAAHAMIFMKNDELMWDRFPKRGAVMMQMRFDGNIGFPGGLMDIAGEAPVDCLNRELMEEIGLDLEKYALCQESHLVSHVHQAKRLVTHFYIKEVDPEDFKNIERDTLKAEDWGTETNGIIRVPLTVLGDGYRGLPVFLSNKFAGNARAQLILGLRKSGLFNEEDLDMVLKAYASYIEKMQ